MGCFASKEEEQLQGKLSQLAAPTSAKICYCTDVEGHWPYFCNYVALSRGIRFSKDGEYHNAADIPDLLLEDDWHFVFGGDSCDKGPGTVRFLRAVVQLKKRYPERVHLILGNRDVNKIRWTSEVFEESELARLSPEVPGGYWVPQKARTSPWAYLRKIAAAAESVEEDELTEEQVKKYNTKANRLRYHMKHDMGADGEFEFRREELALLNGQELKEVSDEMVVADYERSLAEGGEMREYMRLASLVCCIGDTLIVHGQIIGCEDDSWSLTTVPGGDEADGTQPFRTVGTLQEWIAALNAWGRQQVEDWIERPTWVVPPTEPTLDSWAARGGAELIAYGTPATRVPSVVYSRWLDSNFMPKPFPSELTQFLQKQGIRRLIVGHTPHGSCPTIVPNDGLTLVMGDTSFSSMGSNKAYKGDNRGESVCAIMVEEGGCAIKGRAGSPDQVMDYVVYPDATLDENLIGRLIPEQEGEAEQGEQDCGTLQHTLARGCFVKAKLDPRDGEKESRYLTCRVDGFRYAYYEETEKELKDLFGLTATVSTVKSRIELDDGPTGDDGHMVVERIFQMMDKDGDQVMTKRELAAAVSCPSVRKALEWNFPTVPLDKVFTQMDLDGDGVVSHSEFMATMKSENESGRLSSVQEVQEDELLNRQQSRHSQSTAPKGRKLSGSNKVSKRASAKSRNAKKDVGK
eukprot:TRINITY_DN31592_c0_g1_i1.p1 TRINITY_DN31592_c0_g1~~TRINITY_DN31592_c0_g1_i1.p1  ORF type:complete len:728 (-),score=133.43 TRINITY_DN31592_c0_g1_i1:16-2082(-)